MPLSSVSRRRWLIAALVPLALAGCSALQTGPRHLDISEAQLLSRIAARFPVKQRYLGLFEVTLERPRLRLLPEENRLGTEVDYLLGLPLPPLQSLDEAQLSPMARGFYAENRRVANAKAKRMLGWRPAYPDYVTGLRALNAITSPASASTDPAIASADQR